MPLNQPARLAYGLAVLLSKARTRLGLLRLAGWPAAMVARGLIARHHPDLVLVEFGFSRCARDGGGSRNVPWWCISVAPTCLRGANWVCCAVVIAD